MDNWRDDRTPNFPPWSVGDRQPPLTDRFLEPDRVTPLNLTGATVAFEMQLANRTGSLISGAATIVGDPVQGQVEYSWDVSDLATAGHYDGEFVITKSDGTQQTWPPRPYRIVVRERI